MHKIKTDKDWIAKRVSHNVESASHFEARLHFNDTYLVKSCNKYIEHDTLSLRSSCALAVKLHSWFEMARVFFCLLNVKMRADFF